MGAPSRRMFPRVAARLAVFSPDLPGITPMSTGDISQSGVFVYSAHSISLGQTITLSLSAGEASVTVRGEVVHSLPGVGVGVAFVEVEAGWPDQLAQLVAAAEALAA